MGAFDTAQTNLGAFLANAYSGLDLVSESVGRAVWSGWDNDRRFAVLCLADWALREQQRGALEARVAELSEADLSCVPKPLETFVCDRHLLVVEEWVEGRKWEQAVLSREMALETSIELFDLLGELHELNIVHGRIAPQYLLIESSTGRLKLLGLLSQLPAPELTPEDDLAAALAILEPFLSEGERKELQTISSPRELSKRLSRMLSTAEPALSEPRFVGRDSALKELNGIWPQGGMVLVEAPAGGGKTRLLKEWTAGSGGRVLWAKADREVAPSPFKLFQSPFGQLEAELPKQPELLGRLESELNLKLPLLDSLQSRGILERGTLVWLSKLLTTLHDHQPTVLVLDDCQWADELTLRFLEFWSSGSHGGLVVATYRPEEVEAAHPLKGLNCRRIQLPALTENQAGRLLRSAEPSASQTLVESALRRAAGNPFLLLQFLRSGQLQGNLHQVRVASLEAPTRTTLAVASVLGREFETALLSACLETDSAALDLEPAVEAGLVEPKEQGFRFFHDRFREACSSVLEADEIPKIHRLAAEYLERTRPDDVFAIAYHFQSAGLPQRGLKFSLEAADKARGKHDLATAIYYLRTAVEGANGSPELPSLHYQLGDCCRLTGAYRESQDCFEQALALSQDQLTKGRILHALGDVFFKQGQLDKARAAIVEGLALFGDRQPASVLASFLGQATRLVFYSAFPSRRRLEEGEADLLRANLYNRLAYVCWFLEGPIPSIRAHLCELNIAERYPDTPELARAQANHAMAMSAIPWWSRALKYGKQALSTASALGDRLCQGQTGHFYGAALLGACRLKEAQARLIEAQKVLEETGDRWEENGVAYHLALTYYRLGALEKAAELAMRTQQVGVELNDRLAAGDNLNTWARACHGRLPQGCLEDEKRHSSPDLQRACELLSAEALGAIRSGDYGKAEELLKKAWGLYQAKRVQNLYSAFIPCWLTTAQRLKAQGAQGSERKPCLEKARSSLKVALRLAGRYRTNLPHALREQGLLYLLEGRHSKAKQTLDSSVITAQQLGLNHERLLSLEVTNRYAWLLGGPSQPTNRSVDVEWILGERDCDGNLAGAQLEKLLLAANDISNCLSQETTLHQLCRGCRQCLELDETAVVRVHPEGAVEQLSGDFRATLPSPPFEDSGWRVRTLPGLREPLYLLLKRPPGRELGDQEEQLVDFLIAVTGAALDRAQRTESSTVLSQDLRESSLRLNEESGQLLRAREQLLLSERLALTGRLAAGLVHDLRNLVMGITGNAQLLALDSPAGEERSLEINDILGAGKKAAQLLEHLGGLSRGDIIGPQLLDINRRLNETRSLFSSLCGPTVALDFVLNPVEQVLVDPIQLDRIVLNLIVNARDAVGQGGSIQVTTQDVSFQEPQPLFPATVPPGHYSVISVEDNGEGIAPEVLPRIFELHFTTKEQHGTGIGLATVLDLMEGHGGYMTVETSSEGTTFDLYFQAEERSAESSLQSPSRASLVCGPA